MASSVPNPRRPEGQKVAQTPDEGHQDDPQFNVVVPENGANSGEPSDPPPTPSSTLSSSTAEITEDLLNSLKVSQNYSALTGVKGVTTTIPIKKPTKLSFIRTHPDDAYQTTMPVIELDQLGGGLFLVRNPELVRLLRAEPAFDYRTLILAMDSLFNLFFWPLRQPRTDGRVDSWSESARIAALTGRTQWIRVIPNQTIGGYDLRSPEDLIDDPVWPTLSLSELLTIAFRGRQIDSWDHVALRALRGKKPS